MAVKASVAAVKTGVALAAKALSPVFKLQTAQHVVNVGANTINALREAETAEERVDALRNAGTEGIMLLANMSRVGSFALDAQQLHHNITNWSAGVADKGFMRHLTSTGMAVVGMATAGVIRGPVGRVVKRSQTLEL